MQVRDRSCWSQGYVWLVRALRVPLRVLAVMGGLIWGSAAAQVEQTFQLQPGWNAIYLNVEPESRDPASVFGNIPGLESVWTWNPEAAAVQYIQDPSTLVPDQSEWLVYFPASAPEAFLSSLYAVQARRAYLIRVGGTQALSWSVSGTPLADGFNWTPNAFNLVGFDINPAAQVSFASFFSASAAHAGQELYRLSNTHGRWELVTDPANASMVQGEAFWVYTAGESDYAGPVGVGLQQGVGLDFGASLVEQAITVRNRAPTPDTVTLRVQAGGDVPLRYWEEGASPEEAGWQTMPAVLSLTLEGNEQRPLRLGVQRPANSENVQYASVLEVISNSGVRRLLPVSATGRGQAGLWVGYATVGAVSEPVSSDPSTPTPSASAFSFRLLVHVDEAGQARLLKEVVQMWQDGTYASDPADPSKLIVDQPGHYVLITDDSRIAQFEGVAFRDGRPVARRLSAPAFDYAGDTLAMGGSFAGTLMATIDLPAALASNPFKHRYHPDHDNLDPQGLLVEEAYAISRVLELEFTPSDPSGLGAVSWGDTETGGIYRESISGLHKETINVQGVFRLHRSALTGVLNQ